MTTPTPTFEIINTQTGICSPIGETSTLVEIEVNETTYSFEVETNSNAVYDPMCGYQIFVDGDEYDHSDDSIVTNKQLNEIIEAAEKSHEELNEKNRLAKFKESDEYKEIQDGAMKICKMLGGDDSEKFIPLSSALYNIDGYGEIAPYMIDLQINHNCTPEQSEEICEIFM